MSSCASSDCMTIWALYDCMCMTMWALYDYMSTVWLYEHCMTVWALYEVWLSVWCLGSAFVAVKYDTKITSYIYFEVLLCAQCTTLLLTPHPVDGPCSSSSSSLSEWSSGRSASASLIPPWSLSPCSRPVSQWHSELLSYSVRQAGRQADRQ